MYKLCPTEIKWGGKRGEGLPQTNCAQLINQIRREVNKQTDSENTFYLFHRCFNKLQNAFRSHNLERKFIILAMVSNPTYGG